MDVEKKTTTIRVILKDLQTLLRRQIRLLREFLEFRKSLPGTPPEVERPS